MNKVVLILLCLWISYCTGHEFVIKDSRYKKKLYCEDYTDSARFISYFILGIGFLVDDRFISSGSFKCTEK
jgi:hypothetical protein